MHGVRKQNRKEQKMANSINLARLIKKCSEAWETLDEYRERYGYGSECEKLATCEAVTYLDALETITGRGWYYDTDKCLMQLEK